MVDGGGGCSGSGPLLRSEIGDLRSSMLRIGSPCQQSNNALKLLKNKMKSLKVTQVKDEMDGDEDDGCDVVGVIFHMLSHKQI